MAAGIEPRLCHPECSASRHPQVRGGGSVPAARFRVALPFQSEAEDDNAGGVLSAARRRRRTPIAKKLTLGRQRARAAAELHATPSRAVRRAHQARVRHAPGTRRGARPPLCAAQRHVDGKGTTRKTPLSKPSRPGRPAGGTGPARQGQDTPRRGARVGCPACPRTGPGAPAVRGRPFTRRTRCEGRCPAGSRFPRGFPSWPLSGQRHAGLPRPTLSLPVRDQNWPSDMAQQLACGAATPSRAGRGEGHYRPSPSQLSRPSRPSSPPPSPAHFSIGLWIAFGLCDSTRSLSSATARQATSSGQWAPCT